MKAKKKEERTRNKIDTNDFTKAIGKIMTSKKAKPNL